MLDLPIEPSPPPPNYVPNEIHEAMVFYVLSSVDNSTPLTYVDSSLHDGRVCPLLKPPHSTVHHGAEVGQTAGTNVLTAMLSPYVTHV